MARLGEPPSCPLCNCRDSSVEEVFEGGLEDEVITVRCIQCRRLYVVERHVDVYFVARKLTTEDSSTVAAS